MAAPPASAITVCSTCGELLNKNGDCLACLLRAGLEEAKAETEPPVSLTFGDFEVEQHPDGSYRELGRGAMGVTYLARDRVLQRRVALKVIEVPETAAGSQTVRERFLREARAAAALRHPNVAAVFQFGASPDGTRCYYAMELVEGETLEARIRRDGPLKTKPALEIAIQITRALMAAAAHGLIHRDLKPANIMLTPGGADAPEMGVKVIDFGLAKLIAEAEGEMNLTSGGFVGTPNFASPEQFGRGQVDARSDIYSLGATLWFALTGLAPRSGSTIEEIRDHQTRGNLPVEQLVTRKVPRPVGHLLRSTLAVDPAQRPASARELMAALESCRRKIDHRIPISYTGAALIVLLALIVATLFVLRPSARKTTVVSAKNVAPSGSVSLPEKSIAVLPFVDLSQAKDQEYMCDGISEELLDSLSRVEGLRVVARTSSFSFKGKTVAVAEIARQLGVQNILEGSVRRDGNRIRITAQLINAQDGFHLWSETFEREPQGVFAVQDEITSAIVEKLRVKLALPLRARAAKNPAAHELYLRGLYFSNKSSEAELRKALTLFQKALAEDPNMARAWTGIAKVWLWLADEYVTPLEGFAAMEAAANKALALNPNDAEARCHLGEAKWFLNWDPASAEAEIERALAIDPHSASAHLLLALLQPFRGDCAAGIAHIRAAEELDPLSPVITNRKKSLMIRCNRLDEALMAAQRTVELDPKFIYREPPLAAVYRAQGKSDQALALYLKAAEVRHRPSSGLALAYGELGREAEAREVLRQLLERRKSRYMRADAIAGIYAALDDREEAFAWLETAYREHSSSLPNVAFLSEFGSLLSDPRFADLMRRIGLDPAVILNRTRFP